MKCAHLELHDGQVVIVCGPHRLERRCETCGQRGATQLYD
jgi:hypothetical protein